MQVIFRTSYDQDIDHLVDRGEKYRILAAIALALIAPLLVGSYLLSELAIFLVYILAGLGLMVLTGFSGQVSFGHAAFLGIGAYAHSIFLGYGIPFVVSLPMAGLLSGAIGAALGRAVSRMHGFYLAIATLAFAIVVETVIGEWEQVTGGHMGMQVPALSVFGLELGESWQQYYLILAVVIFFIWGVANLMRSPTGRAMVAVRDSEASARSLGLDTARTKILAFFISALITGVAGGLLAHLLFYLAPESFGVQDSLRLLLMIIVGGLGTITGAVFGAVFVTVLPNIIGVLKQILPDTVANAPGLEQLLFGAIIAGFIIFEPEGLYGRWRKLRLFFETYPYYKKSTFVRQKRYLKTERFR
ncbi:branched-chain amino acid ABC transporter permease [Hoeflea sp. WL0058]|uniref:Branched-chain amino acid ABC transporter permease n=1 Tax=Flavimaribacter sediminis TaxID=2865987 RepID=A0AAE2ZKH0_9HYPH|nr:branched-chain amino acid ABC transporter permease [Flavimaribacter sediminis]MBW8636327.1 branched-chain amino acid ABC transporter permease [Flavimaribacter sediminis]